MSLSTQLFVRFYLVIVISLVTVGWSVELIWQYFYADDESQTLHSSQALQSQLELAALTLERTSEESIQSTLSQLNQITNSPIGIISRDKISTGSLTQELDSNKVVALLNTDNSMALYRQIEGTDLLATTNVNPPSTQDWTKQQLLILFYFIIAIVVYLWIRPLTRDLKKLEVAANNFKHAKWNSSIDLTNSSPVKLLADAYNGLLQQIEKLLKEQQEMSHAISHEIRTPLARIKFSIEMASNSATSDNVKLQLQSITEDINEIQQLVDELLRYAALEKNTTSANWEKGDIHSLLDSLVDKLQRNSADKEITVNLDRNATIILCDSFLIERAVQNLIMNAIRHSQSKVHVSFEQFNNTNRIKVEDDGAGISAENAAHIFESFVQVNKSNQMKGFGLGLAIVKRIAKLHKGQITLEKSTLGGACFVLSWPIYKL